MPPDSRNSNGRIAVAVQVASLLATGVVVWIRAVSPRLHRYSWATLIGTALGYAVFAYAASFVITLALLAAVPRRDRGDILWRTFRVSSVAVWFAPAIILLSQFSPMGLAAAMVLVINTTRLLYSEWRRSNEVEDWDFPKPRDAMFGEADPPRPLLLMDLAPALAVALSLQAAGTAGMMRAHLLAGALLAMGAAMLTAFALSTGVLDTDRPQSLPRAFLGVSLTILMAAGLTVGGLRGRIIRRAQPMADGSEAIPVPPEPPSQTSGMFPEGSFPGIILLPEEHKVTMLVEPVTAGQALFGVKARPFAIDFQGEYWMYRQGDFIMYRALQLRPPPKALLQKGTPAAYSYSTTDHWPLVMEAHQKLDQPIDLGCCSHVNVELWNADRFPGTVSLELRVRSGTDWKGLGEQPVRSSPNLRKDPLVAVSETLEFPLPADLGTYACSELQVAFRRNKLRVDKSARIAISRFVLVPR